jgi:hypothetical protein
VNSVLISTCLWAMLIVAVAALAAVVRPTPRLALPTRQRAAAVAVGSVAVIAALLLLPTRDRRVERPAARIDDFMPVWQFGEFHTSTVDAPPAVVFDAIKGLRPDEIFLFKTLIWLRTGGAPLTGVVADATKQYESLIDIATHSTFIYLADEPPHEFVVGTIVGWPEGPRPKVSPEMFRASLPPGFALATMNYVVTPAAGGGSRISTETRVFANSASARRRFAAYWRTIYPGSALIRRMSLRGIERRALIAREFRRE